MDGIATAAWIPYARDMEGRRVRRKGVLKLVAARRGVRRGMVVECRRKNGLIGCDVQCSIVHRGA